MRKVAQNLLRLTTARILIVSCAASFNASAVDQDEVKDSRDGQMHRHAVGLLWSPKRIHLRAD